MGLFNLFKKNQPQKTTVPPKEQEQAAPIKAVLPKENTTVVECHHVTGTSHYQKAIISLSYENSDFDMTKKEILDSCMEDEKIYKFDFYPKNVELIEEPDNEFDPKAVKVIIDGEHVGYIKKGSCSHIKKLIKEDRIKSISAEIGGGKYKILVSDYDYEKDKDVYLMEKGEKPFFVNIDITLK